MGTFQYHQEQAEMPSATRVSEQVWTSGTELEVGISKQDISVGRKQMYSLALMILEVFSNL